MQVSAKPKIVRVSILPFGMLNCHLIIGENTCILVDTGLPGSEAKVGRALSRHRLGFTDIKLIIVTHAHVDHAGSAARLRELSGAPVVAHVGDIDFYTQRRKMSFCSTGWFGRWFLRTGLILQPYTAFIPDILLQEDQVLKLDRFGINGVAQHTPGHTAGSVSVQLATGEAMVGDLLASGVLLGGLVRTAHAMRPPFEDDPDAVALELQRMVDCGMQRFYMGHGGPLIAGEVQRHAHELHELRALKYEKKHRQCCP